MRFARQLRALSRLEIQDVRPLRRALREGELPRLLDGFSVEAEGLVALLRACDGLEDEVGRCARLDGAHLRGDVRQHADLRRDVVFALDLVKAGEDAFCALGGVARRVQADHRIARAEAQPLQHRRDDAVNVVRRVVRLQAARERAGQADGRVAVRRNGHLFRAGDEVEITHQLADGGDHLARQAAPHPRDVGGRGRLGQQPFAQLRDAPAANFAVNALVDVVLDDARDLVVLVGHGGVFAQVGQQQLRQHDLRRDAFLGAACRDARELVARFFLVRLGEDVLHVPEGVGLSEQQCFQLQRNSSFIIM